MFTKILFYNGFAIIFLTSLILSFLVSLLLLKNRGLKNHLYLNWDIMFIRGISLSFISALIFSFLFLPQFIKFKYTKQFAMTFSINEFVGFLGIILLIIIVSWEHLQKVLQRYQNNYKLTNPPFVYLDYGISFIIFSSFLIVITQSDNFFKIPKQFLQYLNMYMAIGVAWLLISYCLAKKTTEKKSSEPLNFSRIDEPIKCLEEDSLDRHKFVEDLYKIIDGFKLKNSFVIGLYGSWGEGKTSILNILTNKFSNNKRFLVLNFQPWHFKDADAITMAFYKELEDLFSRNYILPNLRNNFMRFREIISCGFSKCGIKLNFLGLNFEFLSRQQDSADNFNNIKEQIEHYISLTQKKLLIVIDDIDRLQKEQILFIFKLVFSNTRFKNTIFILSLDHNATIRNINDATGNMGREYISKIIQQPIPLPKIETTFLDKFLWLSDHHVPRYTIPDVINLKLKDSNISTCGVIQKINSNLLEVSYEDNIKQIIIVEISKEQEELFNQQNFKLRDKIYIEGLYSNDRVIIDDVNSQVKLFRLSWIDVLFSDLLKDGKITMQEIQEFDNEFIYIYQSQLAKLIKTLRDAKRYINSLYASLPPIAEEVNLHDFFLLEFIKVFQKEIYDDLFENWWFYVDERMEGDILFNPLRQYGEEQRRSTIIVNHINEMLKILKNNTDKGVFIEVLKTLFPNVKKAFQENEQR